MSGFRDQRQPLVEPLGLDHHMRDMSVTASAELTLGQLKFRLAEHAQWVPVDGDPGHTLGRLVETNSSGPLRLGYGAWRDLLLGCQFRNGRDELITAGGRTVKNVAGYDLTKFMVGQRGVFGTLVTLTMRTYRRPSGAIVAQFTTGADPLPALLPTGGRPHWAILNPQGLHLGYLGEQTTLQYFRAHIDKYGPSEVLELTIEQEIEHRRTLWRGDESRSFRISLPPARLREFVRAVEIPTWSADPAFGIVVGACGSDANRMRIGAAAVAAGGTAVFADTDDPAGWVASATPGEKLLLQRLKSAFDPDNRLAPLPC